MPERIPWLTEEQRVVLAGALEDLHETRFSKNFGLVWQLQDYPAATRHLVFAACMRYWDSDEIKRICVYTEWPERGDPKDYVIGVGTTGAWFPISSFSHHDAGLLALITQSQRAWQGYKSSTWWITLIAFGGLFSGTLDYVFDEGTWLLPVVILIVSGLVLFDILLTPVRRWYKRKKRLAAWKALTEPITEPPRKPVTARAPQEPMRLDPRRI